ncbi:MULTISPECIES: TauD/TfdA family dioxygenase [unclassified Streptomyces]|uniref:TauD/TfdA family dioxygenase n=1 Tax=unclassified Streptomyces TaxID=2593676 RepID=UPI0022B6704D|nr:MULTISPECIES: TauD/TfdA family dioxygenase [unclassified Streptomyces]MCZ7416881.1 TauD/TfdA family dioxygenase [Streptomyces sp. WMMC897]MCZ7433302.1 TauD/TfdA family dioxygenase [Streptomyces sp. WMMC1477]
MRQRFEIGQHGGGDGALVTAAENRPLDAVERDWLLEQLAASGYLVLRGFDPSIEQFSSLVRSVCTRTTLDPAREFSEGRTVQKVDLGTDAVGLHVEHGTNPLTPDLTWFLCERAARVGSQTTVCDGYRVWEHLSEETRRLFLAQDVVYARNIGEETWRPLTASLLAGAKPDDEITVDDLVGLAALFGEDQLAVRANDDGSIHYVYRVAAAHPTLFGERLAFANSILGPSYHYEKPRIAFADGEEIPKEVIEEIERVTAELTEDLDWQDGDVAIVDNTRVMHGRRAIEDADRRNIYVALGYVDDRR